MMFSIIVPVFNGECCISQCLNSIFSQSYGLYEVIVVDDGSVDKTFSILNEFLKLHDNLKIIRQENQGSSKSRNNAIRQCKGDFIMFVDADDWIEPNTLETIVLHLNLNTEILSFGCFVDFVDANYQLQHSFGSVNEIHKYELIEELFKNDLFNFVWNKVYKRELIIQNDIEFSVEFNQGEDFVFNCHSYQKANTFQNLSECLYHYQKTNVETQVTKFTKNNEYILKQKEKALKQLLQSEKESIFYDYMLREYEVFVLNLFMDKCPYSYKEKIKIIRVNIFNNESTKNIINGKTINLYGKIFKCLFYLKSPLLMVVIYSFLIYIKKLLGNSYNIIRKKIIK